MKERFRTEINLKQNSNSPREILITQKVTVRALVLFTPGPLIIPSEIGFVEQIKLLVFVLPELCKCNHELLV